MVHLSIKGAVFAAGLCGASIGSAEARSQVAPPVEIPSTGSAGQELLTASSYENVQARVDSSLKKGDPVVVHVVVCLADNNQGIVPVKPEELAQGDKPETNLYWGAKFGLKTFFRKTGWDRGVDPIYLNDNILSKITLRRELDRNGEKVPVQVVAEAWSGSAMPQALERFLRINYGTDIEAIKTDAGLFHAGSSAHLIVFVGHNGLMNYALGELPSALPGRQARSAAVLACTSNEYFTQPLRQLGTNPLLMTSGFMAPEAYSLNSLIEEFVAGSPPESIRNAIAASYDAYQHCGLSAARKLFVSHK